MPGSKAVSLKDEPIEETGGGSKGVSRQPSAAGKVSQVADTPKEKKTTSFKKKKPKSKTCVGREKWECEKEPLWRIYMKTIADEARRREEAEREKYGEFHCRRRRQPAALPVPGAATPPLRYELNAFNLDGRQGLGEPPPSPLAVTGIWQSLREPCLRVDSAISTLSSDFEWPELAPCLKRDFVREKKVLARKLKMKQMGATPCEIEEIDSPESSDDEKMQEMANLKELGHARIPFTFPLKREVLMVDRACGERPGLVDGDYIVYELLSDKGFSRTYATVCIRGLTGMHLAELKRTRETTWKFCLYQAIVALLAKTQLRYKYTWSANIDYIYQHAWMIFVHVGFLNVRPNQRFDDVLVYNYKYSVELELVHELKDVPLVLHVSFKYSEKSLQSRQQRPRKELTLTKSSFGAEKPKDAFPLPVHKGTKVIEKWFDQLDIKFTNCIIKTSRFALAFWQDGSFWYLYNPYRCDKFGFWDDTGYASIVKFCSKDSLKRHLMVLMLRAYVYGIETRCAGEKDVFSIQIFQLIYHSCNIQNVKLYTRTPRKPKTKLVKKEGSDPCIFDPLAKLSPKTCEDLAEEDNIYDELDENMEKPKWLQEKKITWTKRPPVTNDCGEEDKEIVKWHAFDVITPRRLYVLWGEMHISDTIFPEENRNKQAGACYAVCAGMSLVNTPEYWNGEVLNAIIINGNRFYSQRKHQVRPRVSEPQPDIDDSTWDDRPTDSFRIGELRFQLRAHAAVRGHLYHRNDHCLWRSLEGLFQRQRFCVFGCESARLGLFKHCGAYYALDARSYGPPVFQRGQGSAYLLRAACLGDLVACLVLLVGSPECSEFALRPLEIVDIVDLGEDPCKPRKKEDCGKADEGLKPVCPLDEEKKKASKKGGMAAVMEGRKNARRTVCSTKVKKRCYD